MGILCFKHSTESTEDPHEVPFTEDLSGEIRFPHIPWYQKIFFGICNTAVLTFVFYPFKRQPHKMVKHTQTIRRLFADKLFECV